MCTLVFVKILRIALKHVIVWVHIAPSRAPQRAAYHHGGYMDTFRFVHEVDGVIRESDLIICRTEAEWQSLPESLSPDWSVVRDRGRVLALSLGQLLPAEPASVPRITDLGRGA
jgi:hypothetical protein